jgi:hypothetical protein
MIIPFLRVEQLSHFEQMQAIFFNNSFVCHHWPPHNHHSVILCLKTGNYFVMTPSCLSLSSTWRSEMETNWYRNLSTIWHHGEESIHSVCLWNQRFHYRDHKTRRWALSCSSPSHIHIICSSKINFNSFLLSALCLLFSKVQTRWKWNNFWYNQVTWRQIYGGQV